MRSVVSCQLTVYSTETASTVGVLVGDPLVSVSQSRAVTDALVIVPVDGVEEHVSDVDIAFVPAVPGVDDARLFTLTVATLPVSVWQEIYVIVAATGI